MAKSLFLVKNLRSSPFAFLLLLRLISTAAAADERNIAQRVRRACRDAFHTQRILERIVPDMYAVLGLSTPQVRYRVHARTRTSEGGE